MSEELLSLIENDRRIPYEIVSAMLQRAEVYCTVNEALLRNRDELQSIFGMRFMKPTELVKELQESGKRQTKVHVHPEST